MGWRTVVVDSACKLSYKNDYMIVKSDKDLQVYIPEIDTLLISNPQFVITGILLCELLKNKVNIVYCDEKHNPYGNIISLIGSYNDSKKISRQIAWREEDKISAFTKIIKQKIKNQASLLDKKGKTEESKMLQNYATEVLPNDITNREGFSAKVYFNALFGKDFSREGISNVNFALNYGYTILLSLFNREIVANGYLTQLGIRHSNEFNHFNFSCDLIEPFRVIVDDFVYDNYPSEFDTEYKHKLVGLLQTKVFIGKEYFLSDAINIYVKNVTDAIDQSKVEELDVYEF